MNCVVDQRSDVKNVPVHTIPSRSELLPFTVSSLLCPWMALSTSRLDLSHSRPHSRYSSPWNASSMITFLLKKLNQTFLHP